jgi:ATP-dependent 26S proteasome regulatory subunit
MKKLWNILINLKINFKTLFKKKIMSKEKLLSKLIKAAANEDDNFSNVEIERIKGGKIQLPEGMSIEEGIKWLERKKDEEERVVSIFYEMKAFPFDGANALFDVCKEVFGFADTISEKGPSGETPPQMIGIKLANGKIKEVPWGRIQFPGFRKEEYLETSYNAKELSFVIRGQIKKKNQETVNMVCIKTQEYLRVNSIYKAKSFKVDLGFLNRGDNPQDPEFMNVSHINEDTVILSERNLNEYSGIFLRLRDSAACIREGISLKHGCVLAGQYGTGKTLLAKLTAKIANDNGWTFIYIEDSSQTKEALRLAEIYAPAVVFAEDIDRVVTDRSKDSVNAILNTLDGIDTKDKAIITVFTTNHLENINSTMMRAGRIDTCIIMDPLNEKTALRFINQFCKTKDGQDLLNPESDYMSAAEALSGIVPAFANDIIQKAKEYRLNRQATYVEPEMIVSAAETSRQHQEFAKPKKMLNGNERLGLAVKTMIEESFDNSDELKDVTEKIAYLRDNF